LDGWINCTRCGHRYSSFISTCPRCGESNAVTRSTNSGRSKKIGIVAGVSVVAVVIAFLALNALPTSLLLPPPESLIPDSSTKNEAPQIIQTEPPPPPPRRDTPPFMNPSQTHDFSVEELRQHALEKINKDRADFGLPPVMLSDNQAAQVHAEDVFNARTISHWMTNGEKPYMTYSRLGGLGDVSQNVAVSGYSQESVEACTYGLARCVPIDPKFAIDMAEYGMMYDDAHADWGHRDNILDKHHTHVSLGVVYDRHYFAFVQNFENQYVRWSQPITYNENSARVSMSGTFADNLRLSTINIFYDPLPTTAVYDAHKDDTSYGLGEFVAVVVEPPPFGAFYREADEYVLIIGEQWRISGQDFNITFSTNKLHEKHGDGVYTIVIWADKGGERLQVTNISVVINK
jgi:uncharacterized protein YkwD